jgi:ribosomal protein S18 acetylase RimI-like enzyme
MTDPEIEIQDATPDDAEAIRDLAVRIWNTCYPGIISQEQIDYMLAWMYAPDQIRREIREKSIVYLKIASNGRMRGFAAFGPGKGDQGESERFLHKLYVDPAVQRRGLGSAAITEIEKRSAEAGAEWIRLRVNRNNRPAIATYEKAGFAILESVCGDIGGGFVMDDFVMGKRIRR